MRGGEALELCGPGIRDNVALAQDGQRRLTLHRFLSDTRSHSCLYLGIQDDIPVTYKKYKYPMGDFAQRPWDHGDPSDNLPLRNEHIREPEHKSPMNKLISTAAYILC